MKFTITVAVLATLASTLTYASPAPKHDRHHHSSSTSSTSAAAPTISTVPGCPYDNPTPNFQTFKGSYGTIAPPVGGTSTGFETCGSAYSGGSYNACAASCQIQRDVCSEREPDKAQCNTQRAQLTCSVVVDTTYYDLLEVSVDAGEVDIKRAYKRKAMQHHPDKNPDEPLAHETFQRIGQAYETLSNPNDRATYDQYGPDGPGRGGGGFNGDMDDLFASMFGGFDFDGMGGGRAGFSFDPSGPGPSRKPKRGRDTTVPYEISLGEAYKGKRVVMMLERDRICAGCKGSGGRHGVKAGTCGKCNGKGSIIADRHLGPGLVGKVRVTCPECDGDGVRLRDKERCKKCKGVKVVKEKKRVEFRIEPGTEDGERIALRGEGDQAPDIPPGDVIFHIHHRPHPLFRPHLTNSSDLRMTRVIRLSEALLGFDRVLFTHLDGRGIRVDSKRGERIVQPGGEWIIRGEGMPKRGKNGEKGDLWVKFEVEMPGVSWAARVDPKGTKVELPPAFPEMDPLPDVVEVRYLSPVR